MKLLVIPRSLKAAIAFLWVVVPLAVIEAALISQEPWWKLPLRSLVTAGIIAAAGALVFSILFAKAKQWALSLFAVAGGIWGLLSAWVAIRVRYPALGFATASILLTVTVAFFWLRRELRRSCLDPRIHWYQSLPKPIPFVRCQLHDAATKGVYHVARLDRGGVFLFRDPLNKQEQTLPELKSGEEQNIRLIFRDQNIVCTGVPVSLLNNRAGAGFKFTAGDPDRRKELGDFIEVLKGEGYVQ